MQKFIYKIKPLVPAPLWRAMTSPYWWWYNRARHQVATLFDPRLSSSQQELLRFKDLPDALTANPFGEWRVHFHVPLTWSGDKISSTAFLVNEEFFKEAILKCRHFEVETYSYGVLPGPKTPIIESIFSELKWADQKLNLKCNTQ